MSADSYCFLVRRITAEMESADSLDCHDPAIMDHFSCGNDCNSSPFFPADQIHFRATIVAAYRLCIITSGRRIIIFLSTVRTHREFLHAGPFPVIWKCIQDRKSGTAAGAVDKWMQITPVFRIVHFFLCILRRLQYPARQKSPLLSSHFL